MVKTINYKLSRVGNLFSLSKINTHVTSFEMKMKCNTQDKCIEMFEMKMKWNTQELLAYMYVHVYEYAILCKNYTQVCMYMYISETDRFHTKYSQLVTKYKTCTLRIHVTLCSVKRWVKTGIKIRTYKMYMYMYTFHTCHSVVCKDSQAIRF